jgi:membrane protease YdiL (CAAX protease family)
LGKDFWAGSVWGFGIITTNVVLMVSFGAYSFGTIALSAAGILKYAFLWAAAYLAVGLAEEFVFRGYLQYTLTRSVGFWPAALVTSILFGLIHLDAQAPWPAVANICLLALIASMALRRTGNLWFAIGCHMGFDWADSFFYSTGRTQVEGHLFHATVHGSNWINGGDWGPEANIFNVFLVAAAIFLLSKVYPEVRYPRAEP